MALNLLWLHPWKAYQIQFLALAVESLGQAYGH